jgi:hypothetical protein
MKEPPVSEVAKVLSRTVDPRRRVREPNTSKLKKKII